MKYSFVIPVYNEEDNVIELTDKIHTTMSSINDDYEIIFVDDGSTDSTLKRLKQLPVEALTQNHEGKSKALKHGFSYASGEIIFTLDGDLQDDPKNIPKFLEAIENHELVVGWRINRNATFDKKLFSTIFNLMTRGLTKVPVHDSNCGFKCFRSKILKDINLEGQFHRSLPALAYFKKFRVGEVIIDNHARKTGKSKYGIGRLFIGFIDLIRITVTGKYVGDDK